jgi:LacI family transcriptional regulator
MSLTSARIRKRAFINGLRRKGIKLEKHFMEEGNHRTDGGHEAMSRLLNHPTRPTAVLASNDMTAIGAMGAIFERGLSIPKDISLIGFDDIELSAFTQPALTTVRLSRQEIAKLAFRALYNTYQTDGVKGAEYTIKPTLVIRKSTGPVHQ